MNRIKFTYRLLALLPVLFMTTLVHAQSSVSAKIDARQITIGDQVKLFIDVKQASGEKIAWAVLPDTFNSLEIVEKGKIDTIKNGNDVIFKQRLLITGWDSGMYTIPAFSFTAIPSSGTPYIINTDSFALIVQTIPVDTTKPFKPIADILPVEMSWKDYIWYILGALLAIGLVIFLIYYFRKNKAVKAPVYAPPAKVETANERALRMLEELEQKELWQKGQVKLYYTELTDILRKFIEERFHTQAMELTSDELLQVIQKHKDMMRYSDTLAIVLRTADMAKFARAEPLPQEHVDAFEHTKQFVLATKPVETVNSDKQ